MTIPPVREGFKQALDRQQCLYPLKAETTCNTFAQHSRSLVARDSHDACINSSATNVS